MLKENTCSCSRPKDDVNLINFLFEFQKLMVYDPNRRISAKNAMLDSYFDDVALVPNITLPTSDSVNSVQSD